MQLFADRSVGTDSGGFTTNTWAASAVGREASRSMASASATVDWGDMITGSGVIRPPAVADA